MNIILFGINIANDEIWIYLNLIHIPCKLFQKCYAWLMYVWWKVSIFVCWLQQHHPLNIELRNMARRCGMSGYTYIHTYQHSFPGHLFQTNCVTPCTFLSPKHEQNTREAKLSGSYTVRTHAWLRELCSFAFIRAHK